MELHRNIYRTVLFSSLIFQYLVLNINAKINPKIVSSNGELILIASDQSNISFTSQGSGRVFIGDVDFQHALKKIADADRSMEVFAVDLENGMNNINDWLNRNNMLKRLYLLELPKTNQSWFHWRYAEYVTTVLRRDVRKLRQLVIRNECVSSPCKHGATCLDIYNGFLCQCPDGWEGILCDKDVDECARFSKTGLGCQHGICENLPGSYKCSCSPGWMGIHCIRKTGDCNTGSNIELCGHGTCISQNNIAGYKCLCDQGWTRDESTGNAYCIKDVDECTSNSPPCSINPKVSCENTPGSFRCGQCPSGYTGNGYSCRDTNECELFNGGCSLNPLVQCYNTLGSRLCGPCPAGYEGDGVTCSYKGICQINNGMCSPLATCTHYPHISTTYVECKCPSGYFGDGIGPHGCRRLHGASCAPNPCKNGECITTSTVLGFQCRCVSGYHGVICDKEDKLCAVNPCLNGGTCINLEDTIHCNCTSQFTGPRCDSERQACDDSYTMNSGTLKYPRDDFVGSENNCVWTIEVDSDKTVNLTFTKFHIGVDIYPCIEDFVQIRDGRSLAAPVIGSYCGTELPNGGSIKSTRNIMYIFLKSSPTSMGNNFMAEWNASKISCNKDIHVISNGTIESPGSPGNYPTNTDCYWSLVAPMGKLLHFTFYSLMIGHSQNCGGDYLEVIPSIKSTDQPQAKFCNSTLPNPMVSMGTEVLIHFHSDDKDTYPGFVINYATVDGIPGCGVTYTDNSGEIQFPPRRRALTFTSFRCSYLIQLRKGLRIIISFNSLALDSSVGCLGDNVAIYEGRSSSSPLIGRYCGTTIPSAYTSISNEIYIEFTTSSYSSNMKFALEYQTVCGGKYTAPSGVITSEGYPVQYLTDLTCIYEIIQPEGSVIQLRLLEFDLELDYDEECTFDYLQIRDGKDDNAPLIGTYCESSIPHLITSSTNYLWMKFVTDHSINRLGFAANYTTIQEGCGGILTKSTGTITTSESLSTGLFKCDWVLSAPQGFLIKMTFLSFQLKNTVRCLSDHVTIFDNSSDSRQSRVLGTYCGNKIPPPVISFSNIATISFSHRKLDKDSGFTIFYNFIQEHLVCGGIYNSPTGFIKSPGTNNNFPTQSDCVWIITVQKGHQILLNTTSFEINTFFKTCKFSYLEIRNGKTAASPLIGKFCGKNIPKHITSHTHHLYLHFISGYSGTRGNFHFTWEETTTGCGGVLDSSTGFIMSPSYPETYVGTCFWQIAVSAGSLVRIIFLDIDLESTTQNTCFIDAVEIFDGNSRSDKSLGKFCNNVHPALLLSTKNHFSIYLHSDRYYQGRGFSLQYFTECNTNLTGFYGVIESPNFGNEFQTAQNCVWHIMVSNKNKINITFSTFNLINLVNYVQISYLNLESNYEIYGTYFANSSLPDIIHLDSDHAEISLVSKNVDMFFGFRLEWSMDGCGGHLHKAGEIKSPNYPKGYPPDVECQWIIETVFDNSIEITFLDIDLERNAECSYDTIKVYSGTDNTSPLIASFCHQDKPVVLTSTGNSMFVIFNADPSYQGKGFHASFRSAPLKCGGKHTSSEGFIFSPNYPNNYKIGDSCGWLLSTDESHLIDLNFEDLDLLTSVNCSAGYVKIYDGPSSESKLLATVCGTHKPNITYSSSGNEMYVFFQGTRQTTKGFKAHFNKACGARIIATKSGSIQMHSLFLRTKLVNCTWTIIAPDPSQHVSLTLTHMDVDLQIYDMENSASISIYNGESHDDPLVGTYKGTKVPPTMISEGNAFHIETDINIHFFATYAVLDSKCGGTLTSFDGYFATPGYPKTYPSDTQCEWTIKVSPGNVIALNFQEFVLPDSPRCNSDYLEIRKNNSKGMLLGVYCGIKKPTNLTHEGTLWLNFKSGQMTGEVAAKGFIAEYSMVREVTLYNMHGQLASPLYPDICRSTEKFSWRITNRLSYRKIHLVFKEFYFDSAMDGECYFSNLQVYDGIDATAPLLGTFCGTENPDPLTSSSDNIFIVTSFDPRLGYKFLIEWKSVFQFRKSSNKNISGCGSEEIMNINDISNYTLTSPGYPNGYAPNLKCEWIFSTVPTNHLKLKFNDISLEQMNVGLNGCYLDYVELHSSKNGKSDWQLITRACGSSPSKPYYNATTYLKVVFFTTNFRNGSGFSANIIEGCGGHVKASAGYITFDPSSPRGTECQWNVTVKAGRRIQVSFSSFNTSHGNECNNYLTLRNGNSEDSPILGQGKYCGTNIPPMLKTTGNHLFIKYNGEANITGFKLIFKEIAHSCGGTIFLSEFNNSVIITSPNYPHPPQPHIECLWTIRSPPSSTVQVDFLNEFHLTAESGCISESVEIRNGGTEFSPLIGKFCNSIPSTQISTDNMIFIKYFTDVDEPGKGFNASIHVATCGGTYRGFSGEIQSSSFNANTNCTWYIIAPEHYFLWLNYSGTQYPGQVCHFTASLDIYEFLRANNSEVKVLDNCYTGGAKRAILNTNEAIIRYTRKTSIGSSAPLNFKIIFNTTYNDCEYHLDTDAGVIKSPFYPRLFSNPHICHWNIEVKRGRRVTFLLQDFDPAPLFGNQSTVLYFFENNYRNQFASILYGQSKHKIQSTSNTMGIYYIMTISPSHRGFMATYNSDEPTPCLGDFRGTNGILAHPPNVTEHYCKWEYQSLDLKNPTLALTIQTSVINDTEYTCKYTESALSIYIVLVDSEHLILQYCRTLINPVVVRLPYQEITVEGNEDTDSEFKYTARYDTYPCGGIVNGETGYITSPNFPNKYPQNIECSWLLKLPKEQQISLTFLALNLGDDCQKSFIIIYNGAYPNDPRIDKYCKSNKPGIIISQTNQVLIEYHSNKDNNGNGFNVTYAPIIQGCGGIFHNNKQFIQTPNYPIEYPANAECLWEARAPNGYYIRLEFLNRFYIEDALFCTHDYVEVFDWINDKWQRKTKSCGRNAPAVISSSSNRIKILFRSNDKINAHGFQAKWEFKCGGIFMPSSQPQYIFSPGYPDSYGNELNCKYHIIYRNSFNKIEFLDYFDLEGDMPSCKYDNVTIEKAIPNWGHVNSIRTYCGEEKPPIVRARGSVIITFRTDFSMGFRGFKFSYKTDECRESITSPKMISLSDVWFSQTRAPYTRYGEMVYCIWNITAPPNKIVVLRVESFDFLSGLGCYLNGVRIYDGPDINYQKLLTTMCGNLTYNLPTIASTNNSMIISMNRYASSKLQGFSADVIFTAGPAEGCGGVITVNNSRVIQVPDGIGDSDCHWTFTAPEDYYLRIKFSDINLPANCGQNKTRGSKNCTCSFIEIRDGSSPLADLIEQLCSDAHGTLQEFSTTLRFGYLRLVTFGTSKNLLTFTVTPVISACGTASLIAVNTTRYLTSPRYPNRYQPNLKCKWRIRGITLASRIKMHFLNFDLLDEGSHGENENICGNDRLEIEENSGQNMYYEGLGPHAVMSGTNVQSYFYAGGFNGKQQFCGKNNKPFNYYSDFHGNIYVTFISTNAEGKGIGFRLAYNLLDTCDSNHTENFGRIVGQPRQNCSILVTVAENRTISLYFRRFWTTYKSDCSSSGMEVFDGSDIKSTSLMRACGYRIPDPVFSTGNTILIHLFWTPKVSTLMSNFDITYTSSDRGRGCGGEIYERYGKFTSPMYPNDYKNDSLCTWDLHVPIGNKMVLKFTVFRITARCIENYVKVTTYDKGVENVHMFCSQDNPALLSSDNRITVEYKSSVHNAGRGWLAQFQTVDRNVINEHIYW